MCIYICMSINNYTKDQIMYMLQTQDDELQSMQRQTTQHYNCKIQILDKVKEQIYSMSYQNMQKHLQFVQLCMQSETYRQLYYLMHMMAHHRYDLTIIFELQPNGLLKFCYETLHAINAYYVSHGEVPLNLGKLHNRNRHINRNLALKAQRDQ